MIHVVLVSAHPTEADARRALVLMADDAVHLGHWQIPTPERPEVHVFADDNETADDLWRAGWIRA